MKKKLELTLIGYFFTFLNLYLTINSKPIAGIAFGFVACYFFIKALTIRKKDDEDR